VKEVDEAAKKAEEVIEAEIAKEVGEATEEVEAVIEMIEAERRQNNLPRNVCRRLVILLPRESARSAIELSLFCEDAAKILSG